MPPKGFICPPARVGSVFRHNHHGHRLALPRMKDIGVLWKTYGPTRSTKAAAEEDLARARRCESRAAMVEFVRQLARAARPAVAKAPGGCNSQAEIGAPALPPAAAAAERRFRLRGKVSPPLKGRECIGRGAATAAAAARGVPARAATRVDSGRKRARPASGAASPPEAPPAAGASADGGGGVAGGARRAGAGGEQEAAAAASRRQQRTRAGAGGEQEAAPAPAGGSYEHPGRADWGRVESGISGLLVGLSQTGPPPPCLGPLLSAGADKFDVLHALAMAQSWAHRIRCTRCPSDNEVDVARMLVRMSLDVNLCSDLLDKLVAAKQNCVASHRPSTEHPLKPFEVVDGKALRAKLTRLIGL